MGIIRLNGKEYNGGDLNAVETTSSAYSQLPSADKQDATKIYFLNDTQSETQDTPIDATTFVNKKETSMSVSANTTSLIWTYQGGSLIGASSFQPNAIPSTATKLKFKITTGSSYSTSEERFKLCIGVKAAYQQTDWVTPEDADWLVSKTYNTQNTVIEDYLDLSDVATDCYLMIACHGWTATFDEVTVEEVLPPTGNTEIKYKDTSYGNNGGGNVYGAFIDTNRIIQAQTAIPANTTATYTATEDCYLLAILRKDDDNASLVYVDGEQIGGIYTNTGYTTDLQGFFIKKGQVVTITVTSESHYTVYGLTQGTNGIFTPIIYSDTERVVGVWRDNKPLYKRTWKFNSTTIINANTWTSLGISGGDMENIIFSETVDDEERTNKVAYCGVRNSYVSIYSTFTTNVLTVTLYYTKTTDVAGSGNWNTDGVPTVHYSTTEQVIGTWIDGKPLYQKTVDFGTIPSNSTKEVDHNISDLKMTVGFEGTMINESVCEILPSGENSNFRIQTTPTKLKVITGASWSDWNDSYITIKYTKTTD